jgi:hypothetical protein
MWNTETRARLVAIEKKTKRYPSDLTDEEWVALEIFLPQPSKRTRPAAGVFPRTSVSPSLTGFLAV